MKNINIITRLLPFLIGMMLFACSDNSDSEAVSWEEDDVPVFVDLRSTPLPNNLTCYLYVFSKGASDTDYKLDANHTMTGAQGRIKLLNKDLALKNYRFLFLATPSSSPEMSVLTKTGSAMTTGDTWSNVMIRPSSELVSADNYSTVLDKSGTAILNQGNIQATLTRLVGQMTFDIYKVKNQDSQYITDTIVPPFFSVLDRVHKIKIEYKRRTKDIIFNAANEPVHFSLWDGIQTQTIEPKLLANKNFRIDTLQTTQDLTLSKIAKGSASIKGGYFMPSNANMEVKMTCYYYDTTPLCGQSHIHAADCFKADSIQLNLPKQGSSLPRLSVKPNHYTVNSAQIRFNRIIDVGATSGFEFDTRWENDKDQNNGN